MEYQKVSGKKCVLIGEQSLLAQCGQRLLAGGFEILAVVTSDEQCRAWAQREALELMSWGSGDLSAILGNLQFDILFSITNLRLLPESLVNHPDRVAINFHDGPLPEMRGLNTPMWALLQGHERHQINWHIMTAGIDTGDLISTENVTIDTDETAFTLNAKCYGAALVAFDRLVEQLQSGRLNRAPQTTEKGVLYKASSRPEALGLVHIDMTSSQVQTLVRALDTGPYENPLTLAKLSIGETLLQVLAVSVHDMESQPLGRVIHAASGSKASEMTLSVGWGAQLLEFEVRYLSGKEASSQAFVGCVLNSLDLSSEAPLKAVTEHIGKAEAAWVSMLQSFEGTSFPYILDGLSGMRDASSEMKIHSQTLPEHPQLLLAVLGYFSRIADQNSVGFGFVPAQNNANLGLCAQMHMIQLSYLQGIIHEQTSLLDQWQKVSKLGPLASDLCVRQRVAGGFSAERVMIRVFQLESDFHQWHSADDSFGVGMYLQSGSGDAASLEPQIKIAVRGVLVKPLEVILQELATFVSQSLHQPFELLELVTGAQRQQMQQLATGPAVVLDKASDHVVAAFQRQVAAYPHRTAVAFENEQLTYDELHHLALRVATRLQLLGVKQGDFVGLMMPRGLHLMPAMLGILYTGAAFVPMDPLYPQDRLEHMVQDSKLALVLRDTNPEDRSSQNNQSDFGSAVSLVTWGELELERIETVMTPILSADLAYMIYTSGSTGLPKGVMVAHEQLSNFCAGMTQVVPQESEQQSTWLAVTSISFDIAILELVWTLCQGMKLVIYNGADLQVGQSVEASAASQPLQHQNTSMDFSLFYWNLATHEDKPGPERYRILLDGARYGDENGFTAVWTPERHFGEFGGLYPNPAVSSAAVAAITQRIHIRAGSCVVPLHHPIRVAEDWAMVDNLSNGRVGLSAAAGWMPNDFVILPDNFENAKEKMFDSLEQIRQLWRGDAVVFPGPRGDVEVKTLPRPVQKELPVWVTTAGNPDNFRRAGALGLSLLTHLLGQTPEELEVKIKLYHEAWAEAGHAGKGHVSLMLHTFIAQTDEEAKLVARQPMKNYLKTALFLVKSAAWEFPTFKRLSESQGQSLDEYFANISEEDMDALLDFAFERYYSTSGLFGSVERCVGIVDRIKGIGVTEIACLIDYGIDTQRVLDHLPFVKQVMDMSQQGVAVNGETSREESSSNNDQAGGEDHGIAALIHRHNVSHFQCTPSMARLFTMDESIQEALNTLSVMLAGGEALPLDLAQSLQARVKGPLLNMYGPTETTIWSSVDVMTHVPQQISLGRPIVNTQLVVMDSKLRLLPQGCPGELWIGGHGVVPGYWERPELTQDRFIQDTIGWSSSGRWYRTGDLVRYDADGQLVYLGRNDFQVKIRGYRIELGEIESQMLAMPGIREAVVAAMTTEHTVEPRLVGYYTLEKNQQIDSTELRQWLSQSLTSFMVPSAFVLLESMPLTPNAKIDRKRLPAPKRRAENHQSAELGSEVTASLSEIQQAVLDIWTDILGVSDLTIDSHFFESGGHSLLVVDMIARLKPLFEKPLRLVDFFRFPKVRDLVAFLSEPVSSEANVTIESAQSRGAARRAARRGR